VEKYEERRTLEKPRLRWDNNIKKDLRQMERWGVVRIHLAEDTDKRQAVVNVVITFQVP
jgi:predicted transcriptional regulator